IVPIWAEGAAAKAVWGIAVLGFAIMGVAFFRAATVRACTRDTTAFVWAALAFFLYAILNGLAHFDNAYEILSGFKRYFQVIGLLFALAWLPVGEKDIARWRKFFLIVALVQLPWAVYELVRLVPIREGFQYAYPGLVPIDVVAGTFGANMTSGSANAEMATFLIIVLLFLLARLRQGTLPKGRLVWLLPLILTPLFLGETKVVVVLLPLAFLTLYRRELLARPHVALAGLVVGALLTVAAGYAYLSITKKTLEAQVAETLSYNVYEKGYGGYALNRTTVLTFWAQRQGLRDPAGAVFGHGLGSAHDPTGGHVARRYPGYGIGLTAASTLLWEQGLVGTGLFLAMLVLAWRAAGRVRKRATEAWMRADAAAIQAALPLFAFYLIYRVALLEGLPFQIVFYGLLGYLAWLARRVGRPAT
ncbi:MAG: hypothetical protein IT368_18470, partial [Candidatus Hydrogenedentes bacterium]|nr:hypothetical protein [Candidatus Hydrogenedentota bacterium]